MACLREVWCKYCRKTIGYYVEEEQRKVLEKSKREHEMHWCPRRSEYPEYMNLGEVLEEIGSEKHED